MKFLKFTFYYEYNSKEGIEIVESFEDSDPEFFARCVCEFYQIRNKLFPKVKKEYYPIIAKAGLGNLIPHEDHRPTLAHDPEAFMAVIDGIHYNQFRAYLRNYPHDDIVVKNYTIPEGRIKHYLEAGHYNFLKNHKGDNRSYNDTIVWYLKRNNLSYSKELSDTINYKTLTGVTALELIEYDQKFYEDMNTGDMPMSFHKKIRALYPDMYEETAHLMSSLKRKGK